MKYKLDDIEKKQAFKVPEGYFEDLPLKIQTRINNERPASSLNPAMRWRLALAATILLIFTLVFILPNGDKSAEELLASVSQDELIAYLEQIELDEYDIARAIEDTDGLFEDENPNVLEGIDIGDEALDDVFLEYDLDDEYL